MVEIISKGRVYGEQRGGIKEGESSGLGLGGEGKWKNRIKLSDIGE